MLAFIELDGSNLYWAGWYDKGGVFSTSLDGSGQIKPLVPVDSYASNAVVSGSNKAFGDTEVFWVDRDLTIKAAAKSP